MAAHVAAIRMSAHLGAGGGEGGGKNGGWSGKRTGNMSQRSAATGGTVGGTPNALGRYESISFTGNPQRPPFRYPETTSLTGDREARSATVNNSYIGLYTRDPGPDGGGGLILRALRTQLQKVGHLKILVGNLMGAAPKATCKASGGVPL